LIETPWNGTTHVPYKMETQVHVGKINNILLNFGTPHRPFHKKGVPIHYIKLHFSLDSLGRKSLLP
jgi:hypothetical protein